MKIDIIDSREQARSNLDKVPDGLYMRVKGPCLVCKSGDSIRIINSTLSSPLLHTAFNGEFVPVKSLTVTI